MYYKEEWINGKLYWKASPNGEWIEFTKQQYAERLLKVESELKNLQLGAVSGRLPNFLYEDEGQIKIGYPGDAVVTDEWNKWKEGNLH